MTSKKFETKINLFVTAQSPPLLSDKASYPSSNYKSSPEKEIYIEKERYAVRWLRCIPFIARRSEQERLERLR